MSTTFSTLIDDVLERLNDDGTLFTRAEILRWLSESYRKLTNQTRHARTFTALDMPPRYTSAYSHPWEFKEDRTFAGTMRKFTYTSQNGQSECMFTWEVQQLDEVPVSPGHIAVTHLWELSQAGGEVDAHYRFVMPRNESVIHAIWHDYELLAPVTARILDSLEDRWWSFDGEPFAWTSTLGDAETFEVYEIETQYQLGYHHQQFDNGGPRAFSGSRTYAVESDTESWGYAYSWDGESTGGSITGIGRRFTFGPEPTGFFYTHDWEGQQLRNETISASTAIVATNPFRYDPDVDPPVQIITAELEIGMFRRALSADRQYFPSGQWQVLGLARIFRSADNNILVWHSVNSEDDITEDAELPLIPDQVTKYIIYQALSVLFNRQGEGYDPALAGHYQLRGSRALVLMLKLGNVTRVAEHYVRDAPRVERGSRATLPRLPSNFPRAPWLRRR